MKKIFFALLVIPNQLFAQFEIGAFTTPAQNMIEKVVKKTLFISNQSFQVKDDKDERYGLNNKEEFGREYSLGIKVSNGVVLTDRAIMPWEYNSIFEKYRKDYTPVISESLYSEIKDTAEYVKANFQEKPLKLLKDSALYFVGTGLFNNEGFQIDNQEGEKDGWFVWILSTPQRDFSKSAKVEFQIFRKKQDVSLKNGTVSVDTPKEKKEILGGIFIVPNYSLIGSITFKLCGIAIYINDDWQLSFPFLTELSKEIASNVPDSYNENKEASELTPVNKSIDLKSPNERKKKRINKNKE